MNCSSLLSCHSEAAGPKNPSSTDKAGERSFAGAQDDILFVPKLFCDSPLILR